MATKTFKTYGKRSTRTVVTSHFPPLEPSLLEDDRVRPSSSSPRSIDARRVDEIGDSDESSTDNRAKAKKVNRKPGLNRNKMHEHLVTPGKRRASNLSIASVSRSAAGHKRLRPFASPTKGRKRCQAPDYPAKSNRIPDQPSPLGEADVNRIHLGQLDNTAGISDGRHFPDFDHVGSIDRAVSSHQRIPSAGTKDDPIDLSEKDGNKIESNSALPLTRKRTGLKGQSRQPTENKVTDQGGPASKTSRTGKGSSGHVPTIPVERATFLADHLASRNPTRSNQLSAENLPDSDKSLPIGAARGRSCQHASRSVPHGTDVPSDPSDSIVRKQRSHGLPCVPSSPSSSGSGAFDPSQISTPRHTPHTAPPQERIPAVGKLTTTGSSPFPGKRRDSPFLWRLGGAVAPSFHEILTSFSDLSISISITATPVSERPPARHDRLTQLLNACQQDVPADFGDFVQEFPRKYYAAPSLYRKVGEASYSEVFAVGDIVLKIIPLLTSKNNSYVADDRPPETPIDDALREILFISRMGSLQGGSGFSALLGAHVVEGVYPTPLLSEWDRWDSSHRSESIRPGIFPHSQLYAIIEMSYSGEDLEKYRFPKRTAWQQAASVFWQVARSLDKAEQHLHFEHRDLHWGQVLIMPMKAAVEAQTASMDDPAHGVTVTIIDFGFSRMDAPDPDEPPFYTPFEPEVFEGEGDYQYDIYRMMRTHNNDSWVEYRPMTNLMWLHYLLVKLLKHKGLRKPLPAKGRVAAATDRETVCYTSLVETEQLLRSVVASASRPQAAGKLRRAGRGTRWECAGDLCDWAREKQWIT